MFVRIEVAIKPEYSDPLAQSLLKRIHGQLPELRKKIRWARLIDVYWLDLPRSREDIIPACQEIFQDRVTQWLFTGNLIPSASGKQGGLEDLMEYSPIRPGKFWGVERRLRTGLTDSRAQAALEALRVVLGSDLQGASTSTGQLLLLEGAQLGETDLAQLAREVWCNQVSETWTILPEHELVRNDRFHQEKKHREDVPRVEGAGSAATPSLQGFARKLQSTRISSMVPPVGAVPSRAVPLLDGKLEQWLEFSKARGLDWTAEHWWVIKAHWDSNRKEDPTETELAVIASCWGDQGRSRIWSAPFEAKDFSRRIENLYAETIGATVQQQPQSWIVSSDEGRPAVLALSEELWLSWASRVSGDGAQRDPYGETLNIVLGTQRDIMASDAFSLPLLQTQVMEGDVIQKGQLRRGSELASNRTQVPMLVGADLGDTSGAGSQPLFMSAVLGQVVGRERGVVRSGDRLGWLATGVSGPAALEDPVYQRKLMDGLKDAQARGLISAIRSSGPQPAIWAALQLAREVGGVSITLSPVQVQDFLSKRECLLLASRPDRWNELKAHCDAWGLGLVNLGGFERTGRLQISRLNEGLADLDLAWLWEGMPRKSLSFEASAPRNESDLRDPDHPPFTRTGDQMLREILSLPQVRSPERILNEFDLEAQAHSVIKPLHSVAVAEGDWIHGPNDGAVVMMSGEQHMVSLAAGACAHRQATTPEWRAWMAVDEALRNLVCTGAQVGAEDGVCALSVQWRGESPDRHPAAAGELVASLDAVRDASLALGIPIVSGAASFSARPIPGVLVSHAVGRLKAARWARSADFKTPSDAVYLLGPNSVTLGGSLFAERFGAVASARALEAPRWGVARKLYSWLSGVRGKEQGRIRSLHDVSDGGLFVSLAEGVMARGLGLAIRMPEHVLPEAWAFGEGFHRLVLSCSEADSSILESEWEAMGIPFQRLGSVTSSGRIEIVGQWSAPVSDLRKAWRAEEVWS